MPFQIIRNDITKVKADVIVNTANPKPVIGGGTDSAIYKAAGEEKLLAERQKIGHIARGEMAVTPAYDLKAKYIIHTVGPIWEGGSKGEFDILRSCYRKPLEKAAELGCESVAFPLIATGVYGFPKDKALQIAMSEISSFLMQDGIEMTVKLVVFGDKAFRLSRNLFFQVESFITDEEVIKAHLDEYGIEQEEFEHIKDRYRREREYERYYPANRPTGVLDFSDECELPETVEFGDIHIGSVGSTSKKPVKKETGSTYKKPFNEHSFDKSLYMNDGKEELPFQKHLLKLIIDRDLDNTTVYKSSNVTKGAFSKIMCGDTKIPKKRAVLGFCIGLKLSLEEAEELLASADMAFNPYDKRDKLVIQCLQRGQYNIDEVNSMLYICHQPLLGN